MVESVRPTPALAWRDRWLAAGIVVVLACTLALVTAPSPTPVFAELLLPSAQADHPFRGIVVLQPDDCVSSVEFLRAIQRPEIRRAIPVEAVVIGSKAAADSTGALLDALGFSMHVRQGNRRTLAAVAALGYRTTPTLVVLDRSSSVRLASATPSSASEFRSLLGALLVLAEAER